MTALHLSEVLTWIDHQYISDLVANACLQIDIAVWFFKVTANPFFSSGF